MATAKKAAKAKPIKKATGTAMMNWDEELAKLADKSVGQEDTAEGGGGIKWFGTKSGVLTFDENTMPGNRVAVIILDAIFEHDFYEGKFDPNNPKPVTCYAMGRDEGELVPHKDVFERGQEQHPTCEGCPQNEFGSADTGRGKACKNQRRLIVIPAGQFAKNGDFKLITDAEHYEDAAMAGVMVSVTSTTNYKSYTKQIGATLRKPLFAVATEISLVPHPKNQFEMRFEALEEVPRELLDTIYKRVIDAETVIETPRNLDEREEQAGRGRATGRGKPAASAKARPGAKKAAPAAKKAVGRKY